MIRTLGCPGDRTVVTTGLREKLIRSAITIPNVRGRRAATDVRQILSLIPSLRVPPAAA
jgi:hypothetical protein